MTVGTPEQITRLRRMKRRAVGFLIGAAAIFALTFTVEETTFMGYVRAASEAAMVGGVADWFAVTALFKHPLGIPIPHTAIVPKSRDALAVAMGRIIRNTFLNPEQVVARIRSIGPSQRLTTYLAEPENASRIAGVAAGLARSVAEATDQEVIQSQIGALLVERAADAELGSAMVTFVHHAVDNRHHVPVIDAAIGAFQDAAASSKPTLRDELRRQSPWWVPESVDDAVFIRLLDGLDQFLGEVKAQPDHPLRLDLDRALVAQVDAMHAEGALADVTSRLRDDLIEHPAVVAWIASLWDGFVGTMGRVADEPLSELRDQVARPLASAAARMADDKALLAKFDDWIISVAELAADNLGAEVANMIESTALSWNIDEATRWVELGVGPDLQIIRINGTVVGGLVGLAIHAITELVGSGRL